MTLLTISSKGWVVIPAPLREKYKLKTGSRVRVVDYGNVLSILPANDDPIAESIGVLKGKTSLAKALLAEREKERQRDRNL
jgi:AbrB family looped-hinge helix DNA binding protein